MVYIYKYLSITKYMGASAQKKESNMAATKGKILWNSKQLNEEKAILGWKINLMV